MDETKLATQYDQAKKQASVFRQRWDSFLDLAYAKLVTDKNQKIRSKIRDGSISSLAFERACRVAAQPASGHIYPLTRHDEGKSQLINLTWNRYCLPRMNSQFPLGIKLRWWEYYSLIFGHMPMMHFYRADDDYVGPDCRVLNPKYVYPQAGRLTPNDCDYIFVDQYFAPSKIKAMKGRDGWNSKNIKSILDSVKIDTVPDNTDQTTNTQSARSEDSLLHVGQVKLTTKYTRGYGKKWVTFAPDYGNKIVREITNPFPSGRIPVVYKYAMPIIDSFYGMGDIERGESLQRGIDSSLNLAIDYLKIMLFPPMIFPADANLSQYPMLAGAKWKSTSSGKPEPVVLSSSAQSAQQHLFQQLKGSMLNQFGTSDTTISSDDKQPGQGKTPSALKLLESREDSRDSWDREMLEIAEEELYNGMLEEMGIKQNTPIDFEIFDEEIRLIAEAGFTDVLEPFDSAVEYWAGINPEDGSEVRIEMPSEAMIQQLKLVPKLNDKGIGRLTVKPEMLIGKYTFNIDTNSTTANSEAEEFERLSALVEFMGTPVAEKAVEAMRAEGRDFDYGALLERYVKGSNIKGDDKLFRDIPESQEQPSPDNVPAPSQQGLPEYELSSEEQFNPSLVSDPNLRNMLIGGQNG